MMYQHVNWMLNKFFRYKIFFRDRYKKSFI